MKKLPLFAAMSLGLMIAGCGKPQPPPPEAVLAELSHLATLKCEFTVVATMIHGDLIRGEDRILERVNGSSYLAFDLNKADYRKDGDTLVFTLPEVEVMSPKLDPSWEKIAEHRSGLTSEKEFNRWRDKAEKEAQERIEKKSRDPELVKLAKEQAAMLIKNFYAPWQGVRIIVK